MYTYIYIYIAIHKQLVLVKSLLSQRSMNRPRRWWWYKIAHGVVVVVYKIAHGVVVHKIAHGGGGV